MVDFSDVVRFAETHRACGGVTPAATPQPSGGYLLTLTCACAAVMDRWVTAEEAAHAPFRTGAPPPALREPDPRRLTPSPAFERARRDTLDADPEPTPTAQAPERPTPCIAPSAALEAVLHEALEAEEAAAAAQAPRSSPPTPAPPAPNKRERTAPSPDLQEVLRQAVAAPATELEPKKPSPPRRAARPAPTANVAATVRAALREQERLRGALARDVDTARPKSRKMWLGLAVLVVLAGAAAGLYVANTPEAERDLAATPGTSAVPGAAAPQNVAGTFVNAVHALRQVQATSGPMTSLPPYEAQVGLAQAIVGRYLDGDAPPDAKRNVRAILDLHLLAVAAWRVRALDTPLAWDPVSGNPALDLCAPVKNAAYIAERPGQNGAQARGRAIARAIPLLWECASTRLAQLDAGR